jgi:hypothetical protein
MTEYKNRKQNIKRILDKYKNTKYKNGSVPNNPRKERKKRKRREN